MTAHDELVPLADAADVDAPEVQGLELFCRPPMTVPDITALRGVIGYAPPRAEHPWLTIRLADGTWIRVAPAEDHLEFYMIEPADELAARRGIQPTFLALWAAYRTIGRLALAALERAANAGITASACPIAGLDVIEVEAQDHSLPAIKLLAQLAEASNAHLRGGTLSIAGDLRADRPIV